MFRMSLLSCVVLAVVAQGTFAQDKKAEPIPLRPFSPPPALQSEPFQPEPVPVLSAAEDEAPVDESESPYREEKKDEWTPAMRVFLNEAPGVQATVQNTVTYIDQIKTVFETVMRNGKAIRTPRQVTQKVARAVRTVTADVTVIDCDDVNVQVSTSEKGAKAFEFEIKGELQLQNGSTLIEAKSAKLVDEKLTLTDVTLSTDSMKMTCTELVLNLKVNALRVGEVTEPVAPKVNPLPGQDPFSTPQPIPTPAASFGGPFYNNSASAVRKKTVKGVIKPN